MTTRIVLAALAVSWLAAAAPDPQRIVFSRVFPVPGQIGLFIANADGSDERSLLASLDIGYNPTWSPDGASIVFTSERDGSADLYRMKPDGSSLDRLTDSPAYDDQATFSPDGKQLAFVSSRAGGTADLWTLDVQTRRAKPLTSGPGGDFRPSWSPDGTWIAFSSDRGAGLPFSHGRWEHLHLVDIYLIHPDGSGLKRLTQQGTDRAFCGNPRWSADSRRVITYCMPAQDTMDYRRADIETGTTKLVSIDVTTGAASNVEAGPGVKIAPSFVEGNEIGFIRKDNARAGIHYASGKTGPKGELRSAAWSPDGKRVAYHKRLPPPPAVGRRMFSRLPAYELRLAGAQLPSFNPSGDRYVMTTYAPTPGANNVIVVEPATNTSTVIFHQDGRSALGAQWSPRGDTIMFGIGPFRAFFNGFHDLFLSKPDRVDGGAQIAAINADGSNFRELTTGPNNNGFPSIAPDGKRFVYRTFGPGGDGLRVMDLESRAVTTLSTGYDNFPLWSPRGDLIMFSRIVDNDYEIFTIKPDGTGVKRLTNSPGNDAHQGWSPDGEHIVFASSRLGFKDEVIYTDAPQPYGELFVMRYDGTGVQQLTDNQWEDGTPAWQPAPRVPQSASGAKK